MDSEKRTGMETFMAVAVRVVGAIITVWVIRIALHLG